MSNTPKYSSLCLVTSANLLFLRLESWRSLYTPAGIYVLKVIYRKTRTRCEVCSKLTIKTLELCSGVFIVKFEHISHFVLVISLLTLNM